MGDTLMPLFYRSTIARTLIALTLLAGAAGLATGQPALAAHQPALMHKTITVLEKPGKSTSGFVFSPATVTIGVGDTVLWKDTTSMVHNVVGQGAAAKIINRPALNTQPYSVTFKQKGTYKYVCQIHPGMAGQVIVK